MVIRDSSILPTTIFNILKASQSVAHSLERSSGTIDRPSFRLQRVLLVAVERRNHLRAQDGQCSPLPSLPQGPMHLRLTSFSQSCMLCSLSFF